MIQALYNFMKTGHNYTRNLHLGLDTLLYHIKLEHIQLVVHRKNQFVLCLNTYTICSMKSNYNIKRDKISFFYA